MPGEGPQGESGSDRTRVLIFSWMGIGDVLFLTPWLPFLTARNTEIVALLKPDTERVLALHPSVAETFSFNRNGFRGPWREKVVSAARLFALLLRLRRHRFDEVYIQNYKNKAVLVAGLIAWILGARRRIGFCIDRRFAAFLTHPIPFPTSVMHEVERYRLLFGIKRDAPADPIRLDLSADEQQWVEGFLRTRGLAGYVIIHPGADFEPKRWGEDRFAELIRLIHGRLGLPVVLTGSPKERGIAERIMSVVSDGVHTVVGETSLGQLAALIKHARCLISNDSGPVHVAVSQGTLVVALFGPTDPRRCGPFGDTQSVVIQAAAEPVYAYGAYPRGLDQRLINAISVTEVFAAVEMLLAGKGTA